MIVDFCRFLLALLTSRRKNRRLEGFYLLTLQPKVRHLWWRLVWQNDQSSILLLKNECEMWKTKRETLSNLPFLV